MATNTPTTPGTDGRPGGIVGTLTTGWIPADPLRLRDLRKQLTKWAHSIGLHPEQVQSLGLAAYEALANIVDHAYSTTPVVNRELLVTAEVVSGAAVITIRDHGRWRPAPASPGPRGHGLILMRRLTDDVRIDTTERGTSVTLCWQLSHM